MLQRLPGGILSELGDIPDWVENTNRPGRFARTIFIAQGIILPFRASAGITAPHG